MERRFHNFFVADFSAVIILYVQISLVDPVVEFFLSFFYFFFLFEVFLSLV